MTRTLRAYGVDVRIDADDAEVLALIDQRLPRFDCVEPAGEPALSYRIVRQQERFVVTRGRRTIMIVDESWLAAYGLVADLQSTLARLAADLTFVHAGVVAIDGRAIVLPAPSGGGKTTMVAALLAAGAEYASDEFAVIDPAGRVHAYPRRLAIRTAGLPVERVLPADLGGRVVDRPLEAAAVVFLRFDPNGTLRLKELSAGQAAVRLLQHCTGARGRPSETLTALRALTSSAAGLEGTRGEAKDAAPALIERLRSADQALVRASY